MRLQKLHVERLRSLESVSIAPSGDFVLFQGENGAGKTSLLESVSFLATGRSFLNSRPGHLISDGASDTLVSGLIQESDNAYQLGIQRDRAGKVSARINGETAKALSELAHRLPFLVVGAEGLGWLAGTPQRRRSILDWGVFHVQKLPGSVFSRYRKALEQRNKALKNDKISQADVAPWDQILAESGQAIVEARQAYLEQLNEVFQGLASGVSGLPEIRLHHRVGYSQDKGNLLAALTRGWQRDRVMGMTHSGPHRGDLEILCRGVAATENLSRGQQKVLVALIVLSQQQLLWSAHQRRVVLLVDDLAAELDDHRQTRLWELMTQTGAQVFITAVDAQRVRPILDSSRKVQTFHVKRGSVVEVEA